jgi:hypothetical protein
MKNKTIIPALLSIMLLLWLAGCGGPHMYVNEEADFGFYEQVGVIPFSNFSSDRSASDKVTATFANELLMLNTVSVANQGDFDKVVREVAKRELVNAIEELTSEETDAIGQAANVQGIFVGAVKEFGMTRSGQNEFPLVSLVVRFVDCPTGQVVWSYEISEKGGPKFPIVPIGETHTLGKMSAKVCRKVAQAFGRLAR